MKRLLVLFAIAFHSFFFIEYEPHMWNPCSKEGCFAIYCPSGGCHVDGRKIICPDDKCVRDVLNRAGEEHLSGVFRVEWIGDNPNPTVTKMTPVKSYEIR